MSIIQTIQSLDVRLKALADIRSKYDPGAGLVVNVSNPGSSKYLELHIADGGDVLNVLQLSMENSRKEILTLARLELRDLQEFLAKYPEA